MIFNPRIHVMKETTTSKMFRRRLKCPDIFTFFSLETGQWILAYWIKKSAHLIDEIEDLGTNFELVTPALIHQIVSCWGPIDWKAKKKRLISKYRDQERTRVEGLRDHQDKYDWLKRRMQAPIPYAFSSPISGGEVL